MNPFSRARSDGTDYFDERDEFAPDHLPDPGPSLEGYDVLAGSLCYAFVLGALFLERR